MEMIDVSVKYYNKTEENLFLKYPNLIELKQLTDKVVSIKKSDLLSYMIFTEQKDIAGFATFLELNNRVEKRLGDIDDYLTFTNRSVQSKFIGACMDNNLTERLGVGLGLSVLNQLHNLTEADWKRIPEVPGPRGFKTLDFEISLASDGASYISVENKGSTVEDNLRKPSNISHHYSSIKNKKISINITTTSHLSLHYGTIGVLDNKKDSIARVWLVDPPSTEIRMDPYKYKLLARLHYYLDEFRNIGIRKRILDALENRITEISNRQDYLSLNNIPLLERIRDSENFYIDNRNSFVAIDTNEAFGKFFTIQIKQNPFLFILAYPKSIIKAIVRQNFNEIIKFNYNPSFLNENIGILLRAKALLHGSQ